MNRRVLLYIFLIILPLILPSCENDMREVDRFIDKDEVGIEKATNVEILYSDSAIVRVRIRGSLMHSYMDKKNPRREFPNGIIVDFFDNKNRPTSKLTSKYAIRMERDNTILVKDSVVVQSLTNSERLETEELTWDEKKEEIFSDRLVTIKNAEEEIQGYNFRSNQDFTDWSMEATTGQMKVNDLEQEEENE